MDRTGIEEAAAEAVRIAFEEMCQTVVSAAEPGTIPEAIVATISLRRSLPGLLALALAPETLDTLARRYLPDEPSSEDLLRDAAGEFANVIAGQLKTSLKGTPFHFDLSTPRITKEFPTLVDPISLGFECDAGRLSLIISLP